MDTSLISVSKIFTERLLRIPDYQRGYAWTEKEVSDFWNDLIHLEENKSHYVGVLTLEDVPEKNVNNWVEDHWIIRSRSYAPYFIVDGQQRMTTVIILIQAIIEEIKSRGLDIQLNYTDIDDIQKKFIFDTKQKNSPSRSYIFGYDKDNPSYEYLKQEIFKEHSINSSKLENTIYTQNLSNAKQFFAKKIKSLTITDIETLYKKVTQNFLFNIYSLDEEIDTYVAFETMNNRGKVLSHLELLKNRLIYLTTKLPEPEDEKDALRHAINECWKSMYHFLGKDIKKRLSDDEFLYHHYILYFKELPSTTEESDNYVLEDSLYYTLNHGVLISGRDEHKRVLIDDIFSSKPLSDKSRNHAVTAEFISNYVMNLKRSVETWYYLHNPDESSYSSEIREWLSRLTKIPSWRICRVLLLELLNNHSSKKSISTILALIERLLFIQTMLLESYHFRNLNLLEVALKFKKESDLDKLASHIRIDTDKLLKFAHKEFSIQFKDSDFYHWTGLKYFLYEYEYTLQSKSKTSRTKLDWDEFRKKEKDIDYNTIEHIYPQRARHSSWTKLFNKYSPKDRKKFRHTIGNLVPLSLKKNASLSNNPFLDKVNRGFRFGCYSENEITSFTTWGPEQIKERSYQLISFMDKRWELGLCPPNIVKDKERAKQFYLNLIGLNMN